MSNAGPPSSLGIGIYGASGRGINNLATKICEKQDALGMRVAAVCSVHAGRLRDAERHLRAVQAKHGREPGFRGYTALEAMLGDEAVDVVLITAPTDAHAEAFERAAAAGKAIVCEKPLAHTPDACERILKASRDHRPRAMLAMTRRYESAWRRARQLVEEGAIGNVQMLQLRSVIPYARFFSRWHRRREWSGGILNEKSSHHFDVLNWFAASAPRSVYTIGGRNVFTPRPGYPARCSQCTYECPYRRCERGGRERRAADEREETTGGLGFDYADDPEGRMIDDRCVWSGDANVEDHAITSIEYENGVKASLFLAIFGYHTEDQETLEVVGDRGKLQLTRQNAQIILDRDFGRSRETLDAGDERHDTSHFGADHTLLEQVPSVARGAHPPAVSVEHGYLASMMAFWAIQSMETGQPVRPSPLATAACPTVAAPRGGRDRSQPPAPGRAVGP